MSRMFGTDGVRGVANSELTVELAMNLGKAGALVLAKDRPRPLIVIGRDTRGSGEMLESALTAGILSTGGDVISAGVMPTPGVACLTKLYGADAGIVISASHNPFQFNGIKFFNSEGFKLDDALEDASRNLGASGLYTFRRVIFPVLLPTVLAIAALNFNGLLTDYDISAFLHHPANPTLGVKIKSLTEEMGNSSDGVALTFVYAVLMMIISAVVLYLVYGRGSRDDLKG